MRLPKSGYLSLDILACMLCICVSGAPFKLLSSSTLALIMLVFSVLELMCLCSVCLQLVIFHKRVVRV